MNDPSLQFFRRWILSASQNLNCIQNVRTKIFRFLRERKWCKNRFEKLKDCHLVKILLSWYSALKFTVSWIFWLLNNHRTYWIYINFIESKKFFYIQEDQTRHSPTGGRSYKRSWNKMPKIPKVLLVWIKILNTISFKKGLISIEFILARSLIKI